jgi:Uma2 family endonuclease
MAVSPRRKLTVDEWLHFPDEELVRTELIDGEVVVSSLPSKRHQLVVVRLVSVFEGHCSAHGGGQVYGSVNLVLTDDTAVGPDLIYVREGEDDPDDPLCFRRPPAIVVEVVSGAARDLRKKKELYEAFGVPEYWAMLPDADRLEGYRLAEGRYGKPVIAEPPEVVSPLALPDLQIDLPYVLRR